MLAVAHSWFLRRSRTVWYPSAVSTARTLSTAAVGRPRDWFMRNNRSRTLVVPLTAIAGRSKSGAYRGRPAGRQTGGPGRALEPSVVAVVGARSRKLAGNVDNADTSAVCGATEEGEEEEEEEEEEEDEEGEEEGGEEEEEEEEEKEGEKLKKEEEEEAISPAVLVALPNGKIVALATDPPPNGLTDPATEKGAVKVAVGKEVPPKGIPAAVGALLVVANTEEPEVVGAPKVSGTVLPKKNGLPKEETGTASAEDAEKEDEEDEEDKTGAEGGGGTLSMAAIFDTACQSLHRSSSKDLEV